MEPITDNPAPPSNPTQKSVLEVVVLAAIVVVLFCVVYSAVRRVTAGPRQFNADLPVSRPLSDKIQDSRLAVLMRGGDVAAVSCGLDKYAHEGCWVYGTEKPSDIYGSPVVQDAYFLGGSDRDYKFRVERTVDKAGASVLTVKSGAEHSNVSMPAMADYIVAIASASIEQRDEWAKEIARDVNVRAKNEASWATVPKKGG